jgi:membrane-bound serine protease (ClpP class)
VDGSAWKDANDEAELVEGYTKRELVQLGGPIDSKGRLLTLTAQQAHEAGFLRRTFAGGSPHPADEAELLASLAAEGALVRKVDMTWMESSSPWLLDVAGVLAALVVLSLMLFMFQGPGFMTVVGGAALVLTVLIHLTASQLHGFPVFLLLLGALLLAAEAFLIPGFGVAGILGIAGMGGGFLLLAGGATIGDAGGLDGDVVKRFAAEFVLTCLAGFALLLLASRWFPSASFGRRLLLEAPRAAGAVVPPAGAPALGAVGTTLSPLRPSGSAEFEGRVVDVVSEGELVTSGVRVRVVAVEGPTVLVRALAPVPAEEGPT